MNLKQNNLRFPQNAKNKNSIIHLLLKLKGTSLWIILLFLTHSVLNAQSQPYYNVTSGHGYGVRFYNSDDFKIHMGGTSNYKYGPVQGYAIKMNMSDSANRGWVWGVEDKTPIAALNTQGNMKLAGTLDVAGLTINGEPLDTGGNIDTDNFTVKNLSLNSGHGYGVRFWNSDTYKIHMGGTSNYKYGPVQGYAIKMNMSDSANRGWVWGVEDKTPIAALNTQGNMKLKGNIDVASLTVGTDKKITGAIAHFDGRVYISEEGGSEEGFDSTSNDNYKDYLLWVEEGIVSNDIAIAEVNHWPDYVFDKDYNLPSLESIEKNIKEKGHLHTMLSAKTIEKKGFTVADMTNRMLKTIEELTLHTIAQEKQIEAQNKMIEKLSKRLGKLEENSQK